jgi:hypothetical protein
VDLILETLASRSFPRHNWIFVITGNPTSDPFGPLEEIDTLVEPLKVVSLYLPQLNQFIEEVFGCSTISR